MPVGTCPIRRGSATVPIDAKEVTLEKLLDQTATRTIRSVQDFGNDRDHSVRIWGLPEDVGDAGGDEEFLKRLPISIMSNTRT